MANLYITPYDYKQAVTGQQILGLVGNLSRISGTLAAGGTTLNIVQATLVALNQYDEIVIFDGPNSEVVTVASPGAVIGSTSIPISPAQFSHAAGTPICSDGTQGSLAATITNACSDLEDICYQPLFQQTVTESLPLGTMRCALGRDMQLYMHPTYFPVQSLSSATVQYLSGSTVTLDVSRAIIESGGLNIKLPLVQAQGTSQMSVWAPPFTRNTPAEVVVTYIAGYTPASLPQSVQRAAILLTSDILSDRLNATGAAEYQVGKVKRSMFPRGDISGENLLHKRAVKLLEPYTRKGW